MREHPDPITSGSAAKKINGIGDYIASRIDSIIKLHSSMESKSTTAPQKPVPKSVDEWLNTLNLSQYIDNFVKNGYDNLKICSELTAEDISILQITLPGHKRTLEIATKELKQALSQTNTTQMSNQVNPALISFSWDFLKTKTSPESFERGEELFNNNKLKSLKLENRLVKASVEPSGLDNRKPAVSAYSVCLKFNENFTTIEMATCNCPYSKGDWCKHVSNFSGVTKNSELRFFF